MGDCNFLLPWEMKNIFFIFKKKKGLGNVWKSQFNVYPRFMYGYLSFKFFFIIQTL